MKKSWITYLLLIVFAGCGGSSDTANPDTETFGINAPSGNFISSTVEVERRFVYALNRTDNNVSAYVIEGPEGEGDDHGHAHARFLAQEHDHEDEEHEEELHFEELDGSPFVFGGNALVDILSAPDGHYLLVLDNTGLVRTYRIDGFRGFLYLESENQSGVSNPRKLIGSQSGHSVAVLGDQVSLHRVDDEGLLSNSAMVANTNAWVDLEVSDSAAIASTATGVSSFAWSPGAVISTTFDLMLAGLTRGDLTWGDGGLFVVNRQARSLSFLTLGADGSNNLEFDVALPATVTDPLVLQSVFDGEDLLLADTNSVFLLHPENQDLEVEGQVAVDQIASSLFELPELSAFLVGHDQGAGASVIHLEDDTLTLSDEAGPGSTGTVGFGFAERVESVTQTGTF